MAGRQGSLLSLTSPSHSDFGRASLTQVSALKRKKTEGTRKKMLKGQEKRSLLLAMPESPHPQMFVSLLSGMVADRTQALTQLVSMLLVGYVSSPFVVCS